MPLVRRTIIPALLACSIFITVIFSACADKIKSNLIAFEALDESLVKSNIAINNQSKSTLVLLQNKKADPSTAERAGAWYPKAQLIENLSKETYIYIEGLKSDLKKEAGLKTEEDQQSFKKGDKMSVMRLFVKQGKAEELYERLEKYKQDLLAVDPDLLSTFKDILIVTTSSFVSVQNKQDFTHTFFDDIPAIAALAMLSKFQNNVMIIENRTVEFCNNKVNSSHRIFSAYSGFAVINSSYVKASEELEITSGVGAFSTAALPVISINGKNVPTDVDGAAHYKFKASSKPGKHIVPVVISYIDLDGRKQTITKNMEYTVADEGKR